MAIDESHRDPLVETLNEVVVEWRSRALKAEAAERYYKGQDEALRERIAWLEEEVRKCRVAVGYVGDGQDGD